MAYKVNTDSQRENPFSRPSGQTTHPNFMGTFAKLAGDDYTSGLSEEYGIGLHNKNSLKNDKSNNTVLSTQEVDNLYNFYVKEMGDKGYVNIKELQQNKGNYRHGLNIVDNFGEKSREGFGDGKVTKEELKAVTDQLKQDLKDFGTNGEVVLGESARQ